MTLQWLVMLWDILHMSTRIVQNVVHKHTCKPFLQWTPFKLLIISGIYRDMRVSQKLLKAGQRVQTKHSCWSYSGNISLSLAVSVDQSETLFLSYQAMRARSSQVAIQPPSTQLVVHVSGTTNSLTSHILLCDCCTYSMHSTCENMEITGPVISQHGRLVNRSFLIDRKHCFHC